MAILTIKAKYQEEVTIDTDRGFGGFEPGDLICTCQPFFGVPLELELAIRKDGSLIFRAWNWVTRNSIGDWNQYLHTTEVVKSENPFVSPFVPTQEQSDTVAGLVSGRITFEGLKIAVGKTVLDLTKPDFDAEEKRIGRKLYFA